MTQEFDKTLACGIDNGATGSIGVVGVNFEPVLFATPVRKCLDYQKVAKHVTRVDVDELYKQLLITLGDRLPYTKVFMERPLKQPKLFEATCSAMRAHEATLIVLEKLKLPYSFVDSKQWQYEMLPEGIIGSTELKKASMEIGMRKFPRLADDIKKRKEADAILMAQWALQEAK